MSKRLIGLMAGLLLVAAVVIAGCGDSDDEATASSLTKAQFIAQAEKICEETEQRIVADFQTFLKENKGREIGSAKEEDYVDVVETALTVNVEEEIDQIRDLGAPQGDENEVEALLEAREAGLEAAQADPEGAVTDGSAFGDSNKLAKEYGLEDCEYR